MSEKTLRFYTCDVFTDTIFGGNQLAVIPEAEGLDDRTMQNIAKEFNFSETTFVLPPSRPDCDVRVRIFTPARELPFAGHPTVGTAHILAATGRIALNGDLTRVVFEEGVGPVPVEIEARGGQPVFASLGAARSLEFGPGTPPAAKLAPILGLREGDIGCGPYEPAAASLGVPFLLVPLRDADAVSRAALQMDHWRTIADAWAADLYLYSIEIPGGDSGSVRARMFGPSVGVAEDPATGSAALTLCAFLAHLDGRSDFSTERWITQGVEMGRPSRLRIRASASGGKVRSLEVGGSTVPVSSGELLLP